MRIIFDAIQVDFQCFMSCMLPFCNSPTIFTAGLSHYRSRHISGLESALG